MDFDNAIGAIVLIVTAIISIAKSISDKKKKEEEAAEQRRIARETKPRANDLPEATRRQIYGDPDRPLIQTAKPATPLPPTTRRVMTRPPAIPSENPTPTSQPSTPGTILMDWLEDLQRKTMEVDEGRPERKTMIPPLPQPQRRSVVPQPNRSRPSVQPQQARRQRPPAQQPQTAGLSPEVALDRGALSPQTLAAAEAAQIACRESELRRIRDNPCASQLRAILRNPHDIRAGIILGEILGPPKALQ